MDLRGGPPAPLALYWRHLLDRDAYPVKDFHVDRWARCAPRDWLGQLRKDPLGASLLPLEAPPELLAHADSVEELYALCSDARGTRLAAAADATRAAAAVEAEAPTDASAPTGGPGRKWLLWRPLSPGSVPRAVALALDENFRVSIMSDMLERSALAPSLVLPQNTGATYQRPGAGPRARRFRVLCKVGTYAAVSGAQLTNTPPTLERVRHAARITAVLHL